MNGTDVMRLPKIVPGNNLDNVKQVAVLNDVVPASRVQVRVCIIDPLQSDTMGSIDFSRGLWKTHVFVESVGTIVSEEPWTD